MFVSVNKIHSQMFLTKSLSGSQTNPWPGLGATISVVDVVFSEAYSHCYTSQK